jgi:prolipoprotein diacylglyceryltransferase
MCPLKCSEFFPTHQGGAVIRGSQIANVLLRRSNKNSVLKLDALSTGVPLDYVIPNFLIGFLRIRLGNVVSELQTASIVNVVVLQSDFSSPRSVIQALFRCKGV